MQKATFASERPDKLAKVRSNGGKATRTRSKPQRLKKLGAFDLTREKFKI